MRRLQPLNGVLETRDVAKISTAVITWGQRDDRSSRAYSEQRRSRPQKRKSAKTAAVKKSRGIHRPTKAYLSNSIRESGQLERSSLDSSGIPLSFPKVHTHTYTHTRTQARTHTDACKAIIQYCLSIVPFQPRLMSRLAPGACISASH